MAVVLDASVMLRWYFHDEEDLGLDLLQRLDEEVAVVPIHWRSELANGILIGERRGRSAVAQVERLLWLLDGLDLQVDAQGAEHALDRILPLARAHRLTIYDAIYLELAERHGLPLMTFDGPLAAAARSVGLAVLGVGEKD